MALEWGGIESLVDKGIKLKTGEVVPLDVVIFGTGYSRVSVLLLMKHCLTVSYRSPSASMYEEGKGK